MTATRHPAAGDGAVLVSNGTGELGVEATAEWAAQDDPDDDEAAHAGCIEPHQRHDGEYVDCEGNLL